MPGGMLSTVPGRNKVTDTITRATLLRIFRLGAPAVGMAACRADPASPRGAAERFLDAHYVHIDLPAALPFTSGLARQKVESEIALVQGVTIDESTRKPTVHYTLLEEHPDGVRRRSAYVYRGRIIPEGADAFERRWLRDGAARGRRVAGHQLPGVRGMTRARLGIGWPSSCCAPSHRRWPSRAAR